MPENNVVEFRAHSGMDPELIQMQADTYGWVVKWPDPEPPHKPDPVGTNAEAFGAVWCCLALFLFVARWLRKPAVFVFLFFAITQMSAEWIEMKEFDVLTPLHPSGGSGDDYAYYALHVVIETQGWFFRVKVGATTSPQGWSQLRASYPAVASYKGGFSCTWRTSAGTVYATTGNVELAVGSGDLFVQDSATGAISWPLVPTDKLTMSSWTKLYNASQFVIDTNAILVMNNYVHGLTGHTYGAHVQLPANNTDRAITYIATQGEDSLGSKTIQPAGPAVDLYLGGLEDLTPAIQVVQVTGGYVSGTLGFYGLIPEDNPNGLPPTTYVTIATVTPTPETGPNAGATASVDVTTGVTATTGVSTGTVNTVAIPTGTISNPTAPTPTGTTAATKTDIQTMGNQVTAAIQAADARALGSANTTLAGINGVISTGNNSVRALDKINATLEAKLGASSSFDDGNIVAGLNDVKLAVDASTAVIEAQNTVGDVPDSGVTPATTEGLTSTVNFAANHAGSLIGALPVAPTFSAITPSSTIHIAFKIPSPGHSDIDVDKTVDFSQAPYAAPISVFRGCLLVVVTVGFYFGAFWAVRGAVAGK